MFRAVDIACLSDPRLTKQEAKAQGRVLGLGSGFGTGG